ncbi:hypothetical protein P8936_09305 [Edaphobacter paludis]|uniref:TonB-dependent transporter Oar-like beta-barrel domain-containing protein n=1 Tax=Edaphobacter paludis TaxID=3035702 RepID=A0AAU7D3V6_9BACT
MAIFQSGAAMCVPGAWDYVHSAKIKHYWRSDNHNLQSWAPCYWTTNAETGAIAESQKATNFGYTLPDFVQIPNDGANPNVVYTGVRQAWTILDDSNLSKNFSITEAMKLQLRLETFNTFNHPLFSRKLTTTSTNMPGNWRYSREAARATSPGLHRLKVLSVLSQ